MEINSLNTALNQIITKIHALDLAPIKFKLMDKEEGHGWSRDHADRIEIEYKRFLVLVAKHPEAPIAPSKEVDKFWHGHILDTMKYAEDCDHVFGYFLHHFPYFGMRGNEDAANLAAAADTMKRLYQQEFGDATPGQASSYCGAALASSYCGVTAAPSYCGVATASSYCGVTATSSYCGVAGAASSYCGAANFPNARESVLKTALRPTLPSVTTH